MAEYLRVSKEVFTSKTSSGEWTMLSPPQQWNGFAAYSLVEYTTKQNITKELKIVINNYYIS